MVVVAFLFGELVAFTGMYWGAAIIIYFFLGFLAVAYCYGLFLMHKRMKMWDKLVFLCAYIAIAIGYCSYMSQSGIYEKYDKLQYGTEALGDNSYENYDDQSINGKKDYNENTNITVVGEVVSIIQKEYGYMVLLEVEDGLILVQLEDVSKIKYGAILSVSGVINPMKQADNQGNYDERTYLHSNGVLLKIKVKDSSFVENLGDSDSYSFIKESLYKLKKHALRILDMQCDDKEMGIISAVVLGEKSYMDEEIKELYSENSIMHICSVSGLHISVLGMGIYHILRKWMRYTSSTAISTFIMLLFGMMTGGSVSTVRAVIMFVMHLSADVLGRKYDMLSAISLSALLLLWDNPFYITNASFILSYSAMLAVTVTAPLVVSFFNTENNIIKIMLFNISITFTSMPINMCLFYRISSYSIFLNLLVVPLMGIILTMSIVGIVLTSLSVALGEACFGISVYILRFYEWMCRMVDRLPLSSVVTGDLSIDGILMYYMIFILLLWLMYKMRGNHTTQKNIDSQSVIGSRKAGSAYLPMKNVIVIRVVAIAFLIFIMLFIVYRQKSDAFEICFLDVGQGDCAYVHSESGNDYLIDGGSSDEGEIGKYKLESFLECRDVEKLEYVFVSHCDSDHISGILELIERGNIAIDYLVLSQTEKKSPSEGGRMLITLAEEKSIDVLYFESGSYIKDGELEFLCIGPKSGVEYSDINEASMVFFMKYKNLVTFFAGDIGIDTEKILIDDILLFLEQVQKSINEELYVVYKVAHHGSRYSSGEKILEALNPNMAVISCGEDNSYGHPHEETIERLKESGAIILITSIQNQINITFDGKFNVENYGILP